MQAESKQMVPSEMDVEARLRALREKVTANPGLLPLYENAERAFLLLSYLYDAGEFVADNRDGRPDTIGFACPCCLGGVPLEHSSYCLADQLLKKVGVRHG